VLASEDMLKSLSELEAKLLQYRHKGTKQTNPATAITQTVVKHMALL
jgi:hypothetical protein